jgi:hypothetical protein
MRKKLENSEVRRKIDLAIGTQNKEVNVPLIEELVELR